jgi:hypothetical protein
MILSIVFVMGVELVQLTGDVVGGASVIVPVGVDSSEVGTFIPTVSITTGIIDIAPPTITSGMPMNVPNLTSGVDIRCGLTITPSAPTTITPIIITTARTIIIISSALIATSITAASIITTVMVIATVMIIRLAAAVIATTLVIIVRALLIAGALVILLLARPIILVCPVVLMRAIRAAEVHHHGAPY